MVLGKNQGNGVTGLCVYVFCKWVGRERAVRISTKTRRITPVTRLVLGSGLGWVGIRATTLPPARTPHLPPTHLVVGICLAVARPRQVHVEARAGPRAQLPQRPCARVEPPAVAVQRDEQRPRLVVQDVLCGFACRYVCVCVVTYVYVCVI